MSMTLAPSEITNATLIGPLAGGFSAVVCAMSKSTLQRRTVMTRTKNMLWIAVAVIAVLDCAVYVSRAAKAPDKVATSTVFAIHTAFGARLCSSSALLPRSTAAASFLTNERRSTRCRAKMNAVIAITRKRSGNLEIGLPSRLTNVFHAHADGSSQS